MRVFRLFLPAHPLAWPQFRVPRGLVNSLAPHPGGAENHAVVRPGWITARVVSRGVVSCFVEQPLTHQRVWARIDSHVRAGDFLRIQRNVPDSDFANRAIEITESIAVAEPNRCRSVHGGNPPRTLTWPLIGQPLAVRHVRRLVAIAPDE